MAGRFLLEKVQGTANCKKPCVSGRAAHHILLMQLINLIWSELILRHFRANSSVFFFCCVARAVRFRARAPCYYYYRLSGFIKKLRS